MHLEARRERLANSQRQQGDGFTLADAAGWRATAPEAVGHFPLVLRGENKRLLAMTFDQFAPALVQEGLATPEEVKQSVAAGNNDGQTRMRFTRTPAASQPPASEPWPEDEGSSPPTGDHDPYAALRVADYRRLLAVLLLVGLGGEMQAVAIGWELYQRTHEPAALGYTGLAQFLPVLLLSLLAGHAADRYSRKRLLMMALTLSALASLGLAALSRLQGPVPLVYACLTLAGIARAFSARPGRRCCLSWCRRACWPTLSPGTSAVGKWPPSRAPPWADWSLPSPVEPRLSTFLRPPAPWPAPS